MLITLVHKLPAMAGLTARVNPDKLPEMIRIECPR